MTSVTNPRIPELKQALPLCGKARKSAASFLKTSDRGASPEDTLRAIHLSLALKRARRTRPN